MLTPAARHGIPVDRDGGLVWTAETDGKTVIYDTDPGTGFWRRFVVSVAGLLPVQNQL